MVERSTEELCEPIRVSESEVLKQLRGVKGGKAAGPDHVMPSVLKSCADQLYSVLTVIFNQSLAQCKVPLMWKTSCTVPVPKKKCVTTMNDLRSATLTSAIMKVKGWY